MTQLTAVRTASPAVDGTQWWQLSVHTGGLDVADGIIAELVTPLAASARTLGAERWFYTRSVEPAPEVTLRVLAAPWILKQLQARRVRLQGQADGMLRELPARDGFFPQLAQGASSTAAHAPDPRREAEFALCGGPAGLRLAEEVFELSSELAAWASKRFVKSQNRGALSALLLFDTARSMMQGPRAAGWPDRQRLSWDFYWDSHLNGCTADLGMHAPRVRDAMSARVYAKTAGFHGLMAATAAEASVQRRRRRWYRTMDNYLARAARARVDRSAQRLTMYQAHMMMNRLGFSPREEAAMGLYARSWSPERETTAFSFSASREVRSR